MLSGRGGVRIGRRREVEKVRGDLEAVRGGCLPSVGADGGLFDADDGGRSDLRPSLSLRVLDAAEKGAGRSNAECGRRDGGLAIDPSSSVGPSQSLDLRRKRWDAVISH